MWYDLVLNLDVVHFFDPRESRPVLKTVLQYGQRPIFPYRHHLYPPVRQIPNPSAQSQVHRPAAHPPAESDPLNPPGDQIPSNRHSVAPPSAPAAPAAPAALAALASNAPADIIRLS